MRDRNDRINELVKQRRDVILRIAVFVVCVLAMIMIGVSVDGFHWPIMTIWIVYAPGLVLAIRNFLYIRKELAKLGIV